MFQLRLFLVAFEDLASGGGRRGGGPLRCHAPECSRLGVLLVAVVTLTALTLHEHLAHSVTAYEPLTVPALAQTTAYAGALTGDQNLAATCVARQNRLLYRRTPPNTTHYVHETALRLVVGNRAVMRDELLHLTLQAGQPHITVHVIPMTAPVHPALRHHAALSTFAPPLRPLVYSEDGITTVFHDNPYAVEHHQRRLCQLHVRALPAAQSGKAIAH